jgi:hypothetical protein
LSCAIPGLFLVLLASAGGTPAEGGGTRASEDAGDLGFPALFSWGDVDGDGRLDLAAVDEGGGLRLLLDVGDGKFEDVTERIGLAGVTSTALVLWIDYDGDERFDLFVGARAGASRLFRNEQGRLVDVTAATGMALEGSVQSARWFDHDGDGRLDLFAVTAEGSVLFHGLEGGFFEAAELPLAAAALPANPGVLPQPGGREPDAPATVLGPSGPTPRDKRRAPGPVISVGSASVAAGPGQRVALMPMSCMDAIKDQANLPSCVQASSVPSLGRLYPLTSNLFVAVGGNVGIGTTSPTAKLHVAGTARMTGTLTLAPGVDQALDVAAGSIYKGGALFLHTKGGVRCTALGREALASVNAGVPGNTAIGYEALRSTVTGVANTATGSEALRSNTSGSFNTASGNEALQSNSTGSYNTASGHMALYSNTTGSRNTALGCYALGSNTSGIYNTASGYGALRHNTTGSSNTAGGELALYSNTTGFSNTANGCRALFLNTGGAGNTACGSDTLRANSTGANNTASGFNALRYNTTGLSNTADGAGALTFNTSGRWNTASGDRALHNNTTGDNNTAAGNNALQYNTTGIRNTAVGNGALYNNETGNDNIALGADAGSQLILGSDNIALGNVGGAANESATIRIGTAGTQTRAFIAGIRGVTTGNANAIPVLVDSAGQLGTISSSRRFKDEIRDMAELTERLLVLRPVVFRYKTEVPSGERPLEYGLIAEEVAEVFPELVVNDEEGRPFTVKYHLLSSMLLNELRKLHEAGVEHARELEELRSEVTRLRGLETRLAAVEARGG